MNRKSTFLFLSAITLVGCGRVGFDSQVGGTDGGTDTAGVDSSVDVASTDAEQDAPPFLDAPNDVPSADLGTDAPTPRPNFDPKANACLSSNEGPFVPVATFTGGEHAFGLWYQDPYILVADTTGGIRSLTFDGTTFTEVDHVSTVGWAEAIWSADGFFFVSAPGTGLWSFELDPSGNFIARGSELTTLVGARRLWGDGTNLYVPTGDTGTYVVQHDTGVFTPIGPALATLRWANGAYHDGTALWIADQSHVRLATTTVAGLTEVDSFEVDGASRLWELDGQVYVAGGQTLWSFSRSGNTLVMEGSASTLDGAREVWSDGVHVFVAASEAGVYAFRPGPAGPTQVDRFDTPGRSLGIIGDGTHIFVGDGDTGVMAFTGFECDDW